MLVVPTEGRDRPASAILPILPILPKQTLEPERRGQETSGQGHGLFRQRRAPPSIAGATWPVGRAGNEGTAPSGGWLEGALGDEALSHPLTSLSRARQ